MGTTYKLSAADGRYARIVVAPSGGGWRASVVLRLRTGDDAPAEHALGHADGDDRDDVLMRALGLAANLLDMRHIWRVPS